MARRDSRVRLTLRGFYVVIGIGLAALVNIATSGGQWAIIPMILLAVIAIAYEIYVYLTENPSSATDPVWEFSEGRLPYVGMSPMSAADAGIYFGHGIERRTILQRLEASGTAPQDRFIPIMGPSGVGKSSLIQAGVVPVLLRRDRWIVVPAFAPGRHPFEGLAKVLADAVPGIGAVDLARRLRTDSGLLKECLRRVRAEQGRASARVLLVIDQAEELMGAEMAWEREEFLRVVRGAVRDDDRLWIIAITRSEFLTAILQSGFGELLRNPVNVAALGPDELQEVIRGPARRAGVTFDPDNLVYALIADTGGGAALPHLAYVLNKLYIESDDFTIARRDYDRIGGVSGAVADAAERAYETLGMHRDMVIPVLLRFVTRSEDGTVLAQPVAAAELNDRERGLLQPFVDARLVLSADDDSYELAHAAVLSAWPRLVHEIDLLGDLLRRRADLERWAREWDQMGRRNAYLISEERLTEVERWIEQRPELMPGGDTVGEFLRRSRRASDVSMRRLADSVAERALDRLADDPDHALAVSLEALRCAETSATRHALVAALTAARTRAVLRGHSSPLEGIAWSPNGERLATTSNDGTARFWSVTERTQIGPALSHGAVVFGVAWSPDSTRVATACHDGLVRLWSADAVGTPVILEGASDMLWNVAWSPDGAQVAAACHNGTVLVWDVGSAEVALELLGHESVAWGVDFTPDGRSIVTGARDGTIRIWDRGTGAERARFEGHEGWVHDVACSPDGKLVASTGLDQTVRIWDIETGRQVTVLIGHDDTTQGLDWSPDGRWLASGSFDGTVRVWAVETWRPVTVLRGHHEPSMAVSWSADGHYLATGSWDGTIRIWDAFGVGALAHRSGLRGWAQRVAWSPGGDRIVVGVKDGTAHLLAGSDLRTVRVLSGHRSWVHGVAWSPDGASIATGAMDSTARLWDAETGTERAVLSLSTHRPVWGVSFSHDSARLVTASHDFVAQIWDAGSGEELLSLNGHSGFVHDAVFAPDDATVATASEDGTVRLWDAATGEPRLTLSGHRSGVRTVAWSPDGLRIASGSEDETVQVWESMTGRFLYALSAARSGAVECVAWSPNGERLVGGCGDGSVRLWDVQAFRELRTVGVHEARVAGVAFSPDGDRIASASYDGSVRLWNAAGDLESLLEIARARIFRPLTADDRRALLLPDG